jgi:hypothetical protein
MLYIIWGKLESFEDMQALVGIDRCAVIGNDANQPVARHLNSSNHSVSNIKIRAVCPFLKARIAAKCASFPNLTLSTLMWH